jgi:hypothetical protein
MKKRPKRHPQIYAPKMPITKPEIRNGKDENADRGREEFVPPAQPLALRYVRYPVAVLVHGKIAHVAK